MSNNLTLDQATIEKYQQEAKELGAEKVQEEMQKCINFYQNLLEEAERTDDPKKAASETEKALIMGLTYPELEKYVKRLEELFSTYQTIKEPTEI